MADESLVNPRYARFSAAVIFEERFVRFFFFLFCFFFFFLSLSPPPPPPLSVSLPIMRDDTAIWTKENRAAGGELRLCDPEEAGTACIITENKYA